MEENTIGIDYIPVILIRQACHKHDAPQGVPCYWIHTTGGHILKGVCNTRARGAGYTGKPSNKSLRK